MNGTRLRLGLVFLMLGLFAGCQGVDEETPDDHAAATTETSTSSLSTVDKSGWELGREPAPVHLGPGAEVSFPLEDGAELQAFAESVRTEPGDIPRLRYELNGAVSELPLKHTHVSVQIHGPVAEVEVQQTYENPLERALETVYVFPLPENSAVDAMRMVIGERVIEAIIQRREEARQTYEDAKAAGHTAALLEQERPNIFTQSVANIAPKSTIQISTHYVQDLTYDAGEYEFVFPMVVGPRFIGGESLGTASGTGLAPDTTTVPDASRITPPILGQGMRSGHDVSIEIRADVGLTPRNIQVPTHEVAVETKALGFELMLAEAESIPNRDFVLRYEVDSKEVTTSMMTYRDPGRSKVGTFNLLIQPPDLDVDALVGDREFIFVVDVSGSMSGRPLAMCKDAMRQVLQSIRPSDTFNILKFSGGTSILFESSRPASQTNIKDASTYIDDMRAGGGTHLGDAVEKALGAEPAGRNRYVFFMTDAQIGEGAQILAKSVTLLERFQESGHKARVFGVGVGSSVNHALIEDMAKVGDGLAVYATQREEPARAVNRIFEKVDHPVMEQLSIDWNGLEVEETYPRVMPDLFVSRPLMLHGQYSEPGEANITIRGRVDGQRVDIPLHVSFPEVDEDAQVVGTLWARAKIDALEIDEAYGMGSKAVEITEIGLAHSLVTPYTSFVAVDRTQVVGDGKPTLVVQPEEAPESEMTGLLGSGMAAQGFDSTTAGNTAGNYGLGMRGAGRGGGGSSAGFGYGGSNSGGFGVGRFGTTGHGGGGSGGGNYGSAAASLGDKSTGRPKLKPSQPEVTGSLDKRIVRKVLNLHAAKLVACAKGAPGKLVVSWVIDGDGGVSTANIKSATLPDSTVQTCVLGVVKSMRFPVPKGGGAVTVNYPFVFDGGVSDDGQSARAATSFGTNSPTATVGTANLLLALFLAQRNDLLGCLAVAPTTSREEVALSWTVDDGGYPSKPTFKADAETTKTLDCVGERMTYWDFSPFAGGTLSVKLVPM